MNLTLVAYACLQESAVRTSDAVSSAQACAVEVGRQWDAAAREHTALRQRLAQLATSTEEQVRLATATHTARLEAVEARTAVVDQGEQRLEDKLRVFAAGHERLEKDVRAGQERLEKQLRAGQERLEKEARAGQERLEKGVRGLEDLGGRVAGLERAQEDAAAARGAAVDELRGHLRTLDSKTAKEMDKQVVCLCLLGHWKLYLESESEYQLRCETGFLLSSREQPLGSLDLLGCKFWTLIVDLTIPLQSSGWAELKVRCGALTL